MKKQITKHKAHNIFDCLKIHAGIYSPKLVIDNRHKLDAMTNMLTNQIHLTTLDLRILPVNCLIALMGHELGHVTQSSKKHRYWSLVLIFICFILSCVNTELNYDQNISLGRIIIVFFV